MGGGISISVTDHPQINIVTEGSIYIYGGTPHPASVFTFPWPWNLIGHLCHPCHVASPGFSATKRDSCCTFISAFEILAVNPGLEFRWWNTYQQQSITQFQWQCHRTKIWSRCHICASARNDANCEEGFECHFTKRLYRTEYLPTWSLRSVSYWSRLEIYSNRSPQGWRIFTKTPRWTIFIHRVVACQSYLFS